MHWSAGRSTPKGDYTTPSGTKPVAVTIKAEVGSLKGTSRVRVIPDLNWKFDFNDGQIPVTWVGVRARHIPIDYDLLKKIEAKSRLARQLYIYVFGRVRRGPAGAQVRQQHAAANVDGTLAVSRPDRKGHVARKSEGRARSGPQNPG